MYVKYFKRILDFALALFTLILLFPLMFLIGLLVFIFMGKPILFSQQRPGLNGNLFILYKFRTMNNKKDDHNVLLPNSIRITKLGYLLRKTSLDELPEIYNILIGNMSFVGPRPLLVEYLPYYTQEERKRHLVRPGLTGLAQISGRNNINWDERLKKDQEYISSVSFVLDLKIVIRTFICVIALKDIDDNNAEKNLAKIRSKV